MQYRGYGQVLPALFRRTPDRANVIAKPSAIMKIAGSSGSEETGWHDCLGTVSRRWGV
jgi:hypothetical protein